MPHELMRSGAERGCSGKCICTTFSGCRRKRRVGELRVAVLVPADYGGPVNAQATLFAVLRMMERIMQR